MGAPTPESLNPAEGPDPGEESIPFKVGPGDRQPYAPGSHVPLPGTEELHARR